MHEIVPRVSIDRMRALCLLAACLILLPSAGAAPAPWYQWRSAGSPRDVCAQTSPGSGWTRSDGPFVDAGCSRPLRLIRL